MTLYANTTNQSFIKTSEHLKQRGFKYYKKILKVINPNLVNYPEGTFTKEEAIQEAKENFWFFLRELVITKGGVPVTLDIRNFLAMESLIAGYSSINQTGQEESNKYVIGYYIKWKQLRGEQPNIFTLTDEDFNDILSVQHEINALGAGAPKLYIPIRDLRQHIYLSGKIIIYTKNITNRSLGKFFEIANMYDFVSKDVNMLVADYGEEYHTILPRLQNYMEGLSKLTFDNYHRVSISKNILFYEE